MSDVIPAFIARGSAGTAPFAAMNINQPVVIDNGTGLLKAGFAGAETPQCIIPNLIGKPKHKRVMAGAVQGEVFVGSKTEQLRGLLKLERPMAHGIVEDWDVMERIWSHVYVNELKVSPDEHPVLLTEAPLNPRKNRERAAELFFENFNVPALYVSVQSVLSLYASGRTSGVVLDSGDGVTQCVPVVEGFVLPHAITRVDLAGRDVTEHLQMLLRKAGYRFSTSAERELVSHIKEKMCYVAADPAREDADFTAHPEKARTYMLPDGRPLVLGPEMYRAPELLFRPDLVGDESPGIHVALNNAIQKCDLELRAPLYQQIVLSGGTTLFGGFGQRLLNEMKVLAPPTMKLRILSPPERKYSTWIGGSILAALDAFKKIWITRAEWDENRGAILHSKTF